MATASAVRPCRAHSSAMVSVAKSSLAAPSIILDGNPERVPIPSGQRAPAGEARLRAAVGARVVAPSGCSFDVLAPLALMLWSPSEKNLSSCVRHAGARRAVAARRARSAGAAQARASHRAVVGDRRVAGDAGLAVEAALPERRRIHADAA